MIKKELNKISFVVILIFGIMFGLSSWHITAQASDEVPMKEVTATMEKRYKAFGHKKYIPKLKKNFYYMTYNEYFRFLEGDDAYNDMIKLKKQSKKYKEAKTKYKKNYEEWEINQIDEYEEHAEQDLYGSFDKDFNMETYIKVKYSKKDYDAIDLAHCSLENNKYMLNDELLYQNAIETDEATGVTKEFNDFYGNLDIYTGSKAHMRRGCL